METQQPSRLLPWLMVVLTALVVGAGVWWYDHLNTTSPVASVSTTTPVVIASASPSANAIATTNTIGLKPASFSRSRFNFSLTMPAGFVLSYMPGGEGGPSEHIQILKATPDNGVEVVGQTGVDLRAYSNATNETIDAMAQARVKNDQATRRPDVTIDGEKAAVVDIPGMGQTTEYYMVRNGAKFILTKADSEGTVDAASLDIVMKNLKFTK